MSSPSPPPERPQPTQGETVAGGLLALAAVAVWAAAWCPWQIWLRQNSFLDVLVVGVGFGGAMIAARWTVNGPGRWWLRLLQAVTFLVVVISASFQVLFRWFLREEMESDFGRGQISVITLMSIVFLLMQFGVSCALLGLEAVVRKRQFQIGDHRLPPLAATQFTLFDIFQTTTLSTFLLVALLPYDFRGLLVLDLPTLLVAIVYVPAVGSMVAAFSLLAASQAVLFRRHWWVLSANLVAISLIGGLGGFVLDQAKGAYAPWVASVLGVFASSYLLVFLALSALNSWREFDLEPAESGLRFPEEPASDSVPVTS